MAITRKLPVIHHTERSIQDVTYRSIWHKHEQIVPNVYMYSWESDMVSVTKSGYVHEYEIKISRSDFAVDRKKLGKHQALVNGWRDLNEHEERCLNTMSRERFLKYYGHSLTSGDKVIERRPAYFWYVTPADMLKPEEIPAHAGWQTVTPWGRLQVQKEAPRLCKDKITSAQTMTLLLGTYYRYWRLRMKLPEAPTTGVELLDPLDIEAPVEDACFVEKTQIIE